MKQANRKNGAGYEPQVVRFWRGCESPRCLVSMDVHFDLRGLIS